MSFVARKASSSKLREEVDDSKPKSRVSKAQKLKANAIRRQKFTEELSQLEQRVKNFVSHLAVGTS